MDTFAMYRPFGRRTRAFQSSGWELHPSSIPQTAPVLEDVGRQLRELDAAGPMERLPDPDRVVVGIASHLELERSVEGRERDAEVEPDRPGAVPRDLQAGCGGA